MPEVCEPLLNFRTYQNVALLKFEFGENNEHSGALRGELRTVVGWKPFDGLLNMLHQ
jgi:hypothetical protein